LERLRLWILAFMGLKVGIDFGTSNSGVAIFDGHDVHLLPIDRQNIVPEVVKSILYITRDFKHYIGQEAVELYYRHNVGRLRRFEKQWVGEVDYRGSDMHYVRDVFAYVDVLRPGRLMQFIKTALRTGNYPGTQVFDRYYTLSDLIAVYLSALKERAEILLKESISGVTLGRPVKFSEDLRKDQQAEETLRQAAHQAGFQQVSFELEPVAAALFYELSLEQPQNTLIFDFGGGTLDITIMRLGDPSNRKVFANNGIGIAGSDFDRAIIDKRLVPHFGKGQADLDPDLLELVHAVSDWVALPDLSTPPTKYKLERAIREGIAPSRLKALEALIFNDFAFSFYNSVEAAKILLSSQGSTVIGLQSKDMDIWELYTRHQLERDILEYRETIREVMLQTVSSSGLEPGQIDAVVKTGGSSSIPVFSEMLGDIFGKERVKSSDVFSSVTSGLAIRARSN
jgi:hypothetical chaperone protein